MQFRERRRVIQVIRTVYDKEKKRGRSEVVGKLDKATPVITDKLRKHCSEAELAEIGRWLEERENSLRNEALRAAAAALPQRIREAVAYFRSAPPPDDALAHAAAIRAVWPELKDALSVGGFTKGKLNKYLAKRRKARAGKAPMANGDATLAAPEAAPVDVVLAEGAPPADAEGHVTSAEANPGALEFVDPVPDTAPTANGDAAKAAAAGEEADTGIGSAEADGPTTAKTGEDTRAMHV